MATSAGHGEFSADCVYTLDQLASRLGRSRQWVHDHLIEPNDHDTSEPIAGADGLPLPGVAHVVLGSTVLVAGAELLAWVVANGRQSTFLRKAVKSKSKPKANRDSTEGQPEFNRDCE